MLHALFRNRIANPLQQFRGWTWTGTFLEQELLADHLARGLRVLHRHAGPEAREYDMLSPPPRGYVPGGSSVNTCASIEIGIQTSAGRPTHSPVKPFGVTPRMVYFTPLNVTDRPAISEVRPKRRCQYS